MLKNGLGELLRKEAKNCRRIADLFCGSASVAWFCAQELDRPVLATDLQEYAVVLANAVVTRTVPSCPQEMRENWLQKVPKACEAYSAWANAGELDGRRYNTRTWSKRARDICEKSSNGGGIIWRSYGGHYFSPTQAIIFDGMLDALPLDPSHKVLCLAAAVIAASKCAAAPGHTAQPFKASRTAGPFLREAWVRDPLHYAGQALDLLCPQYARRKGEARVADANTVVSELDAHDLVFIDPPYSGVHYSRFYHVLETLARGCCGHVEGVGRYPPTVERPLSKFSRKSESANAMKDLLLSLASRGCSVILTYPAGPCSNGLSGQALAAMAQTLFKVERHVVTSRFSTLGGNNLHRKARTLSREMFLLLGPR